VKLLVFFTSIAAAVFSVAVMTYISMVVPFGPWVAPTLVLMTSFFFRGVLRHEFKKEALALVVISGSIGGIIGTAFGFSFPTLYFLAPQVFNSWLQSPFYFVSIVFCLSLVAGGFGFIFANLLEHEVLIEEGLRFPVAQMVAGLINAQEKFKKAKELMIGFACAAFYSVLQIKWFGVRVLPRVLTLWNPFCICGQNFSVCFPAVKFHFDTMPLLLSIGFVAGKYVGLPLFIGTATKYFLVDPIEHFFFSDIESPDFLLAFCSGMIFTSASLGFMSAPRFIINGIKNFWLKRKAWEMIGDKASRLRFWEIVIYTPFVISFFYFFEMSIWQQLYLFFGVVVAIYQVVYIAGNTGLAPLGRFATFVMVPALFIFDSGFVQITFIATFVEVSIGVAVDVLFGRKIGLLLDLEKNKLVRYQALGLIVSSLFVGIVLWLLIKNFGLGSDELLAQRAQIRALLINFNSFNLWVALLGSIFGYILFLCNQNSMLILSGFLMPLDYCIGLILGSIISWFINDTEKYLPLVSGIFTYNSFWMFLRCFF